MFATLQLFLLGFDPVVLVADALITAAVLAVGAVVAARGRRAQPPVAAATSDVVAEAEGVVAAAGHRQPA